MDSEGAYMMLWGAGIGLVVGLVLLAGAVIHRDNVWTEKMINRGYIEYQICPDTNDRILVDKETGEELDLKGGETTYDKKQ